MVSGCSTTKRLGTTKIDCVSRKILKREYFSANRIIHLNLRLDAFWLTEHFSPLPAFYRLTNLVYLHRMIFFLQQFKDLCETLFKQFVYQIHFTFKVKDFLTQSSTLNRPIPKMASSLVFKCEVKYERGRHTIQIKASPI